MVGAATVHAAHLSFAHLTLHLIFHIFIKIDFRPFATTLFGIVILAGILSVHAFGYFPEFVLHFREPGATHLNELRRLTHLLEPGIKIGFLAPLLCLEPFRDRRKLFQIFTEIRSFAVFFIIRCFFIFGSCFFINNQ